MQSLTTSRVRGRAIPKTPAMIAAAVLTLSLAACGGGTADDSSSNEPAATFDKFNAMTGQARHDALVAAAEEEGEINFYTTSTAMPDVVAAFQKAYPDITVNHIFATGDELIQRLTQETQAGAESADIFEDAYAADLAAAGEAYQYVNDELTDPLLGFDQAAFVVPTRLTPYISGWITDKVSDAEVPDTIEGFADPKWSGKIAVDQGDWVWYATVMRYYTEKKGWSEDQVDDMFKGMLANADLQSGHTNIATQMLAGQYEASPTLYPTSVLNPKKDDPDAPIDWRTADGGYVAPIPVESEGAVLLKGARHPAAALLFMDFIISDGQAVLNQIGTVVTTLPQSGGLLDGVDENDLQLVSKEDAVDRRDEWADRWDELLRAS